MYFSSSHPSGGIFVAFGRGVSLSHKMKKTLILAAASVLLSSCFVTTGPYGDVDVVATASSVNSVGWVSAYYDASGFPIYGYYNGRAVYGYNPHGSPVFSFSALTATCVVPSWGPADWYGGHWHYPRHIHRTHYPQHHPSGHFPGHRPKHHGGYRR